MIHPDEIFTGLAPLLADSVLRRDEPLARRTTLRVGGRADLYLEPASLPDLCAATDFCRRENVPLFVLGRGSNLLVRDGGIRGLVIGLGHPNFSTVEVEHGALRCGAGARLKAVAARARELDMAGFEFLDGIPGSVGGALRMNAGAMGGAFRDLVQEVEFVGPSGKAERLSSAELPWEYRSCAFFTRNIAVGATLRGRPGVREEISRRAAEFNQKRWSSQPKEPSAGCIFKNPSPALSAGRLVEELGGKGLRRGGAEVSEVHGNFIINRGGATASDVLELIDFLRTRARTERGIELETEVEIIGEDHV